jgi:hypothetical protein
LFYLRKSKSLLAKSGTNKGNKALDQLTESEEDDGDYATLREIPSDTMSEENKVLTLVFYPYLSDDKLYLLPCYRPLTVIVLSCKCTHAAPWILTTNCTHCPVTGL